MTKVKCATIGLGDIGTDLLNKLMRSDVLEPVWMVSVDPASTGFARARQLGLKTTDQGVDGLLPHVLADRVRIAFDATSDNYRFLVPPTKRMINWSPSWVT